MTRTAWGQRLVEVLNDGQWHRRDDVLANVAGVVPAAVAIRLMDREAANGRRRTGFNPSPRRQLQPEQRVRSGQRRMARQTIDNYVAHGTVERDSDMIRLAPNRMNRQ